jgi:hypothetical protein
VDAARVGELARLAELELLREVFLAVELGDLDAGVGEPPRVVGTDDRRDGQALVAGVVGACHRLIICRLGRASRGGRLPAPWPLVW